MLSANLAKIGSLVSMLELATDVQIFPPKTQYTFYTITLLSLFYSTSEKVHINGSLLPMKQSWKLNYYFTLMDS